ncbi:MAG: PrsW family intramembrane metalloprotease [Haloarculaceae archaeon]
MGERRDPIESMDDGSQDLYGITEWESRTAFDRFAAWLYRAIVLAGRLTVVVLAGLILLAQFLIGGLGLVTNPWVGTFVVLSIVPAFVLAAFLWWADVTTAEPLGLLVATFLLGVLFASFAGVLNTFFEGVLSGFGLGAGPLVVVSLLAFFYLVVGPIEETVKLLAVRLYAYRSDKFDAVIDGAVYGAVAGLGFATIENALYITQSIQAVGGVTNLVGAGSGIAAVRAFAGPGHVIYSAFSGYYLGLAKFNCENAGPIVVKGLIIAALIHATYNAAATIVVPALASLADVSQFVAFFGFVVVYDGLFAFLLVRKLHRYNSAYRAARDRSAGGDAVATDLE